LKDGQVVNLNNAYRKLSDANLIQSPGTLSQLPMRKKSEAGEGRLVKDYVGPNGEQLDSSEEEEEESSDDEDRGRKKSPRSLIHGTGPGNGQSTASGSQPGGRQALSLLAAAEQERKRIKNMASLKCEQPRHNRKRKSRTKALTFLNRFTSSISTASVSVPLPIRGT
jgi:hypothetical protein